MRLLFTKGKGPIGRAICWALQSRMSHVVIEYNGLVFHSNFFGVHAIPLEQFLRKAEVVEILETDLKWRELMTTFNKYWHAKYDFLAFAHLGARALLRKLGLKLPKANLWQVTGMFLCTEWVSRTLDGTERTLIPEQLYERLTK